MSVLVVLQQPVQTVGVSVPAEPPIRRAAAPQHLSGVVVFRSQEQLAKHVTDDCDAIQSAELNDHRPCFGEPRRGGLQVAGREVELREIPQCSGDAISLSHAPALVG